MNEDTFIHFYEFDIQFQGIRRTLGKRMDDFKKCGGVITPDFSIYRDRPLIVQKMNTFLNRMIGVILQKNGVYVIPNIRFGDERTYEFCCKGVPTNSIIAVGAVGCQKKKSEQELFCRGFDYVMQELKPNTVIVYGHLPSELKNKYNNFTHIYEYEAETSKRFK